MLSIDPVENAKLQVSYQVARALADLHNADIEGLPSMAHMDFKPSQFVRLDNLPPKEAAASHWKLNDFNFLNFLYRKKSNHTEICPFTKTYDDGVYRSPEGKHVEDAIIVHKYYIQSN